MALGNKDDTVRVFTRVVVHGCTPPVAGERGHYHPLHPQPATVNTRHTREPLGRNRRESKAEKKVRGSSPLQLDEKNDVIAKSHPAVGRPGRRPKASRRDARVRQRLHGREVRRAAWTCGDRQKKSVRRRTWREADGKRPEGGGGERK